MALLEYFKREDAQYAGCKLPGSQGALAREVPPLVPCGVFENSRKFFNEISKTAIRKNLDPRNLSAIR